MGYLFLVSNNPILMMLVLTLILILLIDLHLIFTKSHDNFLTVSIILANIFFMIATVNYYYLVVIFVLLINIYLRTIMLHGYYFTNSIDNTLLSDEISQSEPYTVAPKQYTIVAFSPSEITEIGTSSDLIDYEPILDRGYSNYENVIAGVICDMVSIISRGDKSGEYFYSYHMEDGNIINLCLMVKPESSLSNMNPISKFVDKQISCTVYIGSIYEERVFKIWIIDTSNDLAESYISSCLNKVINYVEIEILTDLKNMQLTTKVDPFNIKWHYVSSVSYQNITSRSERYAVVIFSSVSDKQIKIGTSNDLITYTPVLSGDNEHPKNKYKNAIILKIHEVISKISQTRVFGQHTRSIYMDNGNHVNINIIAYGFSTKCNRVYCTVYLMSSHKRKIFHVGTIDTFNGPTCIMYKSNYIRNDMLTKLETNIMIRCSYMNKML